MCKTLDFSKRIPQLDGLRGLAISMVLVYHFFPCRLVSLGWSGVDLFFVLSGFLIGGILLDARSSANYFHVFYVRRVCRIFPLYFAVLLLVTLGARFLNPSVFLPAVPWQSAVTFSQNFWMAVHNTLGSYAAGPTWSLAIEEQFYMLLPALIYFVKPSRLPWVLGFGIITAPLVRLGIYAFNPAATTAIYVLLPCRMNALLLGVLAAWFLRQPGKWELAVMHRHEIRIVLVVLAAACSLFLIRPKVTEPLEMFLGFDCFAVLYTLLLIACLIDERIAKVFQEKWLIGIGGIAYCVYLTHHAVFGVTVFALRRWHVHSGIVAIVVALLATIVIARISWKWFERPFIRLGHKTAYSEKPITSRSLPAACTEFVR